MQKLISIAATWFGLGLIRKGPGTFGTLGAIPLVFGLHSLGPLVYMASSLIFVPISMFVAHAYEQTRDQHDASEIVIDEVAGFLVTMTWLPMNWRSLMAGFVLFRCLDIFKPFPIHVLDKKIAGGVGVVVDDLAAGLIANIVLQIIFTQTNWLGEQYLLLGA